MSGCIVGECAVCRDDIHEDDWIFMGDALLHDRCMSGYVKSLFHMSNKQFSTLLEKKELQRDINAMRMVMDGVTATLDELEKRILSLGVAQEDDEGDWVWRD